MGKNKRGGALLKLEKVILSNFIKICKQDYRLLGGLRLGNGLYWTGIAAITASGF
jgi:hypothetical protein